MTKAAALSLRRGFAGLTFAGDRTPESTDIDGAFCRLADYRDGGIFLAHYAGSSEWERHPGGDEIVMVFEGATTLILLVDGEEQRHALREGELLVVPQGTWHRFESPHGVKVVAVTPQPTQHSTESPLRPAAP